MKNVDLTGKVLVVVDMEPGDAQCMSETKLKVVEFLIRQAVRDDAYIIFLEFMGGGTLQRLLQCVRRYDGFTQKEKEEADGSYVVLEACKLAGCDMEGFVLCGVDAACCVAKTAENLADALPGTKIEVVRAGCATVEENWTWDKFPTAPNIILV